MTDKEFEEKKKELLKICYNAKWMTNEVWVFPHDKLKEFEDLVSQATRKEIAGKVKTYLDKSWNINPDEDTILTLIGGGGK